MDSNSADTKLLASSGGVADEHFYDTQQIASSPEYDNAMNQSQPGPTEEEKAEWRAELTKLEDEIMTLRQVLSAKITTATELKRKLGITPMTEFKTDLKQGIQNIKESDAYQKTNAAFKTAGQKTTAALSTFGAFASKKLGDARNSAAFKSFEEKVGGAVTNVKTRVRGSKSEDNFENVLSSTANENMGEESVSLPTTPSTEPALPEEKVPL